MERDQYWRDILDFNLSFCHSSRVGIWELQGGEWVQLEVDRSTINLDYFYIKHRAISRDLEALTGVIIACKDQVFGSLALPLRGERYINVHSCSGM